MPNIAESLETHTGYVPAFIESTKAVFSTMLGWELEVGPTVKGKSFQPGHDVSGIIGFSGSLRGTVVVSLDKEITFAAAEAFIGARPTVIDSDVQDLVAELANMIGGGAKERIDIDQIALGLPTTIVGHEHQISFNPGVEVETVRFQSPFGPLSVQIAIGN